MRRLLLIFGLLLAFPAQADTLPGPVPATVLYVLDGDTLAGRARIWPGHAVETRIRLLGVDSPELFSPKCEGEKALALAAKAYLAGLVKGRTVLLTDIRPDKYSGRVLARVWLDGRDLGAQMLEAGHARSYAGGKRGGWC